MASINNRKPQPNPSTSNRKPQRPRDPGPSSLRGPSLLRADKSSKRARKEPILLRDLLEGPYYNEQYIDAEHNKSPIPLKSLHKDAPRSALNNFYHIVKQKQPNYVSVEGKVMDGSQVVNVWRTTVLVDIDPPITAIGDSTDKKQSINLAALSAIYRLQELGVLDDPTKLLPKGQATALTDITLSDGSVVHYEQARGFMDYYCRKYGFGQPDINFVCDRHTSIWEAIMTVGGRKIGLGSGVSKKAAQMNCYLDVTKYLESCDPELWQAYLEAVRTGKDLGMGPKVVFEVSPTLEDAITDLTDDIRKTNLYRNRPAKVALPAPPTIIGDRSFRFRRPYSYHLAKSKRLQEGRQAYIEGPKMEKMRTTRAALPVYTKSEEVLEHIKKNEVTILMAATGSGKTTQVPQMILDEYIERGEGSRCNIICTQPRRLAAISVADRVAKERGETIGQSIGYQVRFEARHPEPDGSITFCTTGVFLKRLQSALANNPSRDSLDNVTHVIVDEVHERDVDTDLLLVVLKQLLAQKKAKNQSFKIILMSATIDPTLFQQYFKDDTGKAASVISVPGRSFPVTKHYMDELVPKIANGPMRWVFQQESVSQYVYRELGPQTALRFGIQPPRVEKRGDDLDLPFPFIAASVSHVLQNSNDGHVLVFLPGWDDIVSTQKALTDPVASLGIDFRDPKYSIHLLHSTIPLSEQQAIFEPPPEGVRRVILATNIAETSVTIPDVVYVIDSGKVKEQRYDPDRHMSSLVSAWVGSSNLNQRAGRAGRHRSGEYYGILSKDHATTLQPYQTVEMKRVDLCNVVMHVKALNFPGMTVEDVLSAAIEPPDPNRVQAAMRDLQMVGALDSEKNLTSLGRVLLQLPVDAQMGRLVLYGSFFRCLDQALTLAAIFSNRDPFMSPLHLKAEAQARKNSWSPEDFRSDALATLNAFNRWWTLQSRGEYNTANRFCIDNFLSKPTLLLIQKIKSQLLQSLYRAGVIEVSAGGIANMDVNLGARNLVVPPELNANKDSQPLLAALIAIASQPKFAVRNGGGRSYRTSIDKIAMMHPSSVNHRKRETPDGAAPPNEKQLYAFSDKRRNESTPGSGPASTFLVTTTRLDPLTYILFGAYHVEVVERGLECDDWLPIVGDVSVLDDVQRLKKSMEAVMLRVFEGITMSRQHKGQKLPVLPREEEDEFESESEDDRKDYSLSSEEIQELDIMTRDVVRILNRYSDERVANQSRQQSRASTPFGSPISSSTRLPRGSISGYSTPSSFQAWPTFQSRPGTPSRLRRPQNLEPN